MDKLLVQRSGFLSILFVLVALLAACASHTEAYNFSPENPPLEVASQFRDVSGEQVVQGTVRNLSNTEIKDVEAVVEFLSATDRVLDIEIEHLGTLAPNGTKEFTAHHPTQYTATDVTHHRLRFRVGGHGQVLAHKDSFGSRPSQAESGGMSVNYHYADPGGSESLPPVTRGVGENPNRGSHGAAH